MRPSSAWTHALEARQNRWEFMLVVAPHVIPGGTGPVGESPRDVLTARVVHARFHHVAALATRPVFLFWSREASQSKWVDYEWRSAAHARGVGFIDPTPLEKA